MRILYLSIFLFFICSVFSVDVYCQPSKALKDDWAELFPEIPNCERNVQPILQSGKIFVQTTLYINKYLGTDKNGNYFSCGTITLRFEPSARDSARDNLKISGFPLKQKFQIRTFDAYKSSLLCGVGEISLGAFEVYFDKDKVLSVQANNGYQQILDFAENADYKLLRKSMNKFIKNEGKQN